MSPILDSSWPGWIWSVTVESSRSHGWAFTIGCVLRRWTVVPNDTMTKVRFSIETRAIA